MCLRIKERKQQTATHPITVYKIVIQIDNDVRGIYTNKGAYEAFYNECKRANHLGEYNY